MYPELLVPLAACTALLIGALVVAATREPVARRLALRQLVRRHGEVLLAVLGATLGTAIIAAALIVGDTLAFSVRQIAYQTLGPIDERITTSSPETGAAVARRLAPLAHDRDVDGVLDAQVTYAAASTGHGSAARAEPRVLAWQLDLHAADRFGRAGGPSGLGGSTPRPGEVVINRPLADSLHLHTGQTATFYVFQNAYPLRIVRIVAERGVAGAGLGASVNRNAFLPPGLLDQAAASAGKQPQSVTFVSNQGGVQRGAALTAPVLGKIKQALGPLSHTTLVDTPKRDVLGAARKTGDTLGALFLMIGSYSIIAGALLLVNIFVMLADDRKSQLGMLRAIGMRRSRLVTSFTLEGASYAVAAVIPGVVVGIGVGWAVAQVAAQIFRSFSATGQGLAITFAMTPTSLVNAALLGLLIGLVTVLATSIRISRFNIIAAIRDLPASVGARSRRLTVRVTAVLCVVVMVIMVPAIAASQAESTYLLPAVAGLLAIPALSKTIGNKRAVTLVSATVLVWALVAPLVRPHLFDSVSMSAFVIEGTVLAFAGVTLLSQNEQVVLRPVRTLFGRPTQTGLAVRLAIAYPLAKRFRTGATMMMYTLITLVLVLLVEISGIIDANVDRSVANATAGYGMRLDLSPAFGNQTLRALVSGDLATDIGGVAPLTSAAAFASDPGHRTTQPLHAVAVGANPADLAAMTFTSRLSTTPTDQSVWRLLARDPRYVVVDAFFGSSGGPNGKYFEPGDTFVLTDPRSGHTRTRIIAAILSSATAFYPVSGQTAGTFPVVASTQSVRDAFGSSATTSAALLRLRPGVDADALATRIQGHYLAASVVATPIAGSVRRLFSANIAFFRLMQGFLALGLLVGITGLGVVMIRAVRERRRTIGVLRALGFHERTIRRAFLVESGLIAAQGILLGAVLGVLTTWLMYQKSATFSGMHGAFPVEWVVIGALALATLLASLLATVPPARRAARIQPALAVRLAD